MNTTAIDLGNHIRRFGERLLKNCKRLGLQIYNFAYLAARSNADMLYIILGARSSHAATELALARLELQ